MRTYKKLGDDSLEVTETATSTMTRAQIEKLKTDWEASIAQIQVKVDVVKDMLAKLG